MRDITEAAFEKEYRKYGFVREGFGYYRLPAPFQTISVGVLCTTRRARLAYLLHALEREQAKER